MSGLLRPHFINLWILITYNTQSKILTPISTMDAISIRKGDTKDENT